MERIKTFEQFISDLNNQKPVQEGDRLLVKSSKNKIISDNIKEKLWEAMLEALNEAIEFENDEDPEHTLENYMSENVSLFGSTIGRAIDSGHYFDMLSIMSAQIGQGGDAPKSAGNRAIAPTVSEEFDFAGQRDSVKEYLDESIEAMKESFNKSMDAVKKDNNARAIRVANVLKKNHESKNENK